MPQRLRLHPRHVPRPTDATPLALRRALRTGQIRTVPLDPRFDQILLLLARTPGGPSAWVLHQPRGGFRRRWSANVLVGRAAPPPPFPANPRRPAPALREALAGLLPLLPGRARRQKRIADLLRRAHGAVGLDWDVEQRVRPGRGFSRAVPTPFQGMLRIRLPDAPPGPWLEGADLAAAVPAALARILFPTLASRGDVPDPFVSIGGEPPSAHARLEARARLEDLFGPLG